MPAADVPMFSQPNSQEVCLSSHLASGKHRLAKGATAHWRASTAKTARCVECAWRQHETRGAFFPCRRVQQKREYLGNALVLCTAHAELWKDRDGDDSGLGRTSPQQKRTVQHET